MNRTDWKQTRLGSELELLYGRGLPASARVAGDVPVYGSNGVVGLHNKSLVEGTGIIVGRKGSVGEVAFSDGPFWPIDTTYYVANRGGNNWHFVYFLLQHLQLTGLNSHSTVPGLNRESVYSIEWAFPPKSEQEKIAAVLWKIQKTMEIEDAIVRNAHDLKKSLLRRLFTHGLRGEPLKETEIGPLPESWVEVTIGSLGKVVTGTTPPTANREFYDPGEFQFIAPADLGQTTFIYTAEKKITQQGLAVSRVLPKHSVCFVCIGSSIGKVGVTVGAVSTTNQQINSVIVKSDHDPLFVGYLFEFKSSYIASFTSPSPVPILSKGKFEEIKLFVSPDKDEQREIADILQTVDRKIDIHESKKRSLQDLFKTTLHKLMTAQIRVNDLDIDTSEVKGT